MMSVELSTLVNVFITLTLPGGAGGLASFLLAVRNGHYRNNRYKAKFTIEVLGAMVTATALAAVVARFMDSVAGLSLVAFLVGICWAKLLQILRNKIIDNRILHLFRKIKHIVRDRKLQAYLPGIFDCLDSTTSSSVSVLFIINTEAHRHANNVKSCKF